MVLGQALVDAASATDDIEAAAEIGRLADMTQSIKIADRRLPSPRPDRVPVCRFWDDALTLARRAGAAIAPALDRVGSALSWTQNPNYRRDPPDAGFLDNYGYAVIVGPADGPPALVADPGIALGVLLLGPHTHYPLHSHPAVEVYYTLTPGGEWWRGAGPWRREPVGAAIHHTPNVPHATRAGAEPLLAVYLWHGDLGTHARLSSRGAASKPAVEGSSSAGRG